MFALALASCGGSKHAAVAAVSFSPTPIGSETMVAAISPHPGLYVPLSAVRNAIPASFPPNPTQPCKFGVIVRVAFPGGRSISYGPCVRPPAIDRLRKAIITAVARADHLARPSLVVNVFAWKDVLQDWYDGRIDRWHSCAAVRAAIVHLPPEGAAIHSSVRIDLDAYLRAVC
ncbi:MAG TPA: hypothetical protein VGM80_16205 [Gaiellaceae bacterium]